MGSEGGGQGHEPDSPGAQKARKRIPDSFPERTAALRTPVWVPRDLQDGRDMMLNCPGCHLLPVSF